MKENNVNETILYLAGCAVYESVPERAFLEGTDFAMLYEQCKFHEITGLVACALENFASKNLDFAVENNTFSPNYDKFIFDRDYTIRRNMLMHAEMQKLKKFCDENKIWAAPLKGAVIKDLYPGDGMRTQCDFDIVFDKAGAGKIRTFFEEKGYKIDNFGMGVHDTYTKEPFYCFEMHKGLFKEALKKWQNYYDEKLPELMKDKAGFCELPTEDFIIYFVLHAKKHYENSGFGIKFLTDICVLENTYDGKIDKEYIENELKKLDASDFFEISKALAEKLVKNGQTLAELTEEETKFAKRILTSGVLGTTENRVSYGIEKCDENGKITLKSKLKYSIRRIFPPASYLKLDPKTTKHFWIKLPIAWAKRLISGIFVNKRAIKEFNKLKQAKTVDKK